jgi:hypothetical protein
LIVDPQDFYKGRLTRTTKKIAIPRMASQDSEGRPTSLEPSASENTLTTSLNGDTKDTEIPVTADCSMARVVVSEPEDAGHDHDGVSDAHVSAEENDGIHLEFVSNLKTILRDFP